MRFTKKDKKILILTCSIFAFIGIPFAAGGWVGGLALIFFGFSNLVLGIFMPADDEKE